MINTLFSTSGIWGSRVHAACSIYYNHPPLPPGSFYRYCRWHLNSEEIEEQIEGVARTGEPYIGALAISSDLPKCLTIPRHLKLHGVTLIPIYVMPCYALLCCYALLLLCSWHRCTAAIELASWLANWLTS